MLGSIVISTYIQRVRLRLAYIGGLLPHWGWLDIQISLYESCQSHNGNDNGRSTTFSTLAADTMMLLPHCTAMCGLLAVTQTHSLPTPLFYHFRPKLKYFTIVEHMGSKIKNPSLNFFLDLRIKVIFCFRFFKSQLRFKNLLHRLTL